MRRRILIVPEWYPSPENPVLGIFVRDQAVAVAETNDVTVLVHDARRCERLRGCVTQGIEHGLPTFRVRTRAPYGSSPARAEFLLRATGVLRALRRVGRGPDVIHAHVFLAGLPALLLARGRRPVIVSEHHSDFLDGKVVGRAARVAHLVLRRATLVCAVSEHLRRHLEAFEPAGRYEVVPNVVDVAAFAAQPRPAASGRDPMRLLVVALLAPQKGMPYLLDALAQLRRTRTDFVLDVVGDGPSRDEIEALARRLLPPGVVTFHGSRTRAEVAAFMARADIFVLPSTVETFGVVAIEALAAGLPVLTTRGVGAQSVIEPRFGVVVPAGDAGALRDALARMLDGDRPRFSPQAAATETRRYGAAAVARRWDEIYSDVARRR